MLPDDGLQAVFSTRFDVRSVTQIRNRRVSHASGWVTGDAKLSELKLMQREYWAELHDRLDAVGRPVRNKLTSHSEVNTK